MSTPPTSQAVAECVDLHVDHPGGRGAEPTRALRGVSLRIEPGEFVSVVGASGSGKSTLLHTLSGLLPPTSGRVSLLGEEITAASQKQIAAVHRRGVGFIFQSLNLVGSLPALDNVVLPSRFAGQPVDETRARAVLDHLGLGHRVGHLTSDLSGGEQQRVAVARVLFTHPAVVMADEPTGALDSASGTIVLQALRTLADAGTAVVLVTHDLDAATLADRAVVVRDGTIHKHVSAPTRDDLVLPAQTPPGVGSES